MTRFVPTHRTRSTRRVFFAPPGAFPQSGPAEPCLIFWMSRSQNRRCWRVWMRRVDLDSSAYFRCQGSGAAILKGFATIIRLPPRISHQRWRSPCDKRGKSQISQNPDPSPKCDVEAGGRPRTNSHARRTYPECAAAVQTHSKGCSGQLAMKYE